MYLQKKNYVHYSGIIFLVVGLGHAARVFYGWGISVDNWVIPIWVSWVVAAVALYLAFCAYKMSK